MFGYQSSLEQRLYKLNRELMCPVCEGLTLEQSQSGIAIDMREEIKKMIIQGMTDEEIKTYYVEKYPGVNMLATPPASGFNLLMWIIPIIFGLNYSNERKTFRQNYLSLQKKRFCIS